jgi:hypothetical protein
VPRSPRCERPQNVTDLKATILKRMSSGYRTLNVTVNRRLLFSWAALGVAVRGEQHR